MVAGEIAIHHDYSYFFQQGVIEIAQRLSKAVFINTLSALDLRAKSLRIYRVITTIRDASLI